MRISDWSSDVCSSDLGHICMSISATTRPMRPGEKDGVDYHFVNEQAFRKMAGDGAFLEWAHVFGHRYGTPRAPVEAMLADGQDILFDIDWQGAQQLYQDRKSTRLNSSH